jgi:hypothetical protein
MERNTDRFRRAANLPVSNFGGSGLTIFPVTVTSSRYPQNSPRRLS